jgi:hypothetical protein
LETSSGKIQLTLTDRPRPPQPPANDDLEAPREIAERGLRGLGQRLGSALRGALDKPVPVPVQRQQQLQQAPQPLPKGDEKAPPPGTTPPGKKNVPDTDDD